MRKRTKRLVLNRDTLVKMEHNLEQVEGAATAVTDCGSASCPVLCTFSGYRTCVTCGGTCGTNLC
jgi:hypothetical protein